MIRLIVLTGLLTAGMSWDTSLVADDLPPFTIGNREEPDETQLHAFAKHFCVEVRRFDAKSPDATRLRKWFDPEFLKKHNLTEGDLPIQMAPVGNIYDLQVGDDERTILCVVDMRGSASAKEPVKEAILLRVVLRDKALYLSPAKGPDPKSKTFTPWILRRKL